jgi:hypothetical protein
MTIKKRKTKRKIKFKRNTKKIKIGGMAMFKGMINDAKSKVAAVKGKIADVKSQAQEKMTQAKDMAGQAQGKIAEVKSQANNTTIKPQATNTVQPQATNTPKGNIIPLVATPIISTVSQASQNMKAIKGNVTPLAVATNPLISNMNQSELNMKTMTGSLSTDASKGNTIDSAKSNTAISNTSDAAISNTAISNTAKGDTAKGTLMGAISNPMDAVKGKLMGASKGNPMDVAKDKVDDIKNKVQEKIKEYTAKLNKFQGFPLFSIIVKTFAGIYEDNTLLRHIYKSKYIQRNKYLNYIKKLDPLGLKNYNDACCLIYKYYYKNIALNYSYLRESNHISENCKDKKYIEAQLKLYNSTEKKNSEHFNKVFYNRDQFSKLEDIDNVTKMKTAIEDAFIIPTNGIKDPLINNYSYLILYILHDIHRNIEIENIKAAENLKKTKKNKDVTPPKYDITKDAKCTPHKDTDVTCDVADTALSIIAGRTAEPT